MTRLKILAVIGILLGMVSPVAAQSGCGGQFGALKFCGSVAGGLPGPILIPAGGTTPIAGGTILGNPTTGSALPIATIAPVLGIPGTSVGSISLGNATSGTVKLQPVTGALGSTVLSLPNTSGTFAVNASAPLALSATTGNLTITGAAGQVLAGASPAFTATPTLGASGTVGTLAFGNATSGTVTLGTVAGALGSVTLSLPAATDTLVGKATTDVLTNKSLTSSTDVLGGVTMTLGSDATGDIYYRSGGVLTRLPIGSSTNILTVTAGLPSWAAAAAAGVSSFNTLTGAVTTNVVVQKFTATGTYTPTSGMLHAIVECIGGGGGGGSVAGTVSQTYGGAGGGSGGYSMKRIAAADIVTNAAITIGAAGAGGASGSNNGAAGTDTTVISNAVTLCAGKGGAGGLFSSNAQVSLGGAGGVAGTGDVTGAGNPGSPGPYTASNVLVMASGNGGSSVFGGGALGVVTASAATAGNAAGNYGSGGSGALAFQVAANAAGGSGSAGIVVITEFINM